MSDLSRVEDILQATIDGAAYDSAPMSRVEELLLELKAVIEQGGGGGGGSVVSWSQIQTTGTKIAEITINGTPTEVKTPAQTSEIDDSATTSANTWSADKISGEITSHLIADISDVTFGGA